MVPVHGGAQSYSQRRAKFLFLIVPGSTLETPPEIIGAVGLVLTYVPLEWWGSYRSQGHGVASPTFGTQL